MKTQFNLIMNVKRLKQSIDITLEYRCPMISKPYAHSIAGSLRLILGTNLDQRLNSFRNSIVEDDKHTAIGWNPKSVYHHNSCMHHLVQATCRILPNEEAVCAWDGSLSYSQLDALSSMAAEKLAAVGVKPGMHIPFAYEKSLWTVVATLGIMKAGGSFVPLDAQHPESRIVDILAATEAQVVVTSDSLAPAFAKIAKLVVVISATTMKIPSIEQSQKQKHYYSATVKPEDPIFVLYTSGSTGRPKGMVLTHGAISTHAITHGEIMKYHGARVLQFAAHTFDVAIMDIFTTLVYGGCVCIPSEVCICNDTKVSTLYEVMLTVI
jgi:non-ribosomal peptide synthetase component F